MRIGIELRQLIPQQSGGIVPLIEGVAQALFTLGRNDQFFIYHTAAGYRLPGSLPSHVHQQALDADAFWQQLDYAAARDCLDVLFRSYPSNEPIGFPLRRQVVLVPDLQHEVMPEFFDAEVLARRRAAFGDAVAGAGAIAVLSEHGRNMLLEQYPQTKSHVFLMSPALALDTTIFDQPLDEVEESTIPSQPFFLYPANLWPHKNHRRLVAALTLLQQPIALVLTGDPAGWEELRTACRDLPVYHLGFVRKRLLAELYRRAHALTYFSLYEGFGIPLLEAFQVGLPVICSNTTSLPEIGGDAILSCDPTDVPAIAALMARIADDGDLRAQLVERGRQRLAQYSWQRSAQNLLDACRRLADMPSNHAAVLSAISTVSARAAASEVDRAARLDVIQRLDADIRRLQDTLAMSEADRAARLTVIEQLDAAVRELREQLAASETDRAARLELIQTLQQQLQTSEADKVARLDVIRAQQQLLSRPLISLLRRLHIL